MTQLTLPLTETTTPANRLRDAAPSNMNPRYWAWLQCGGVEDRSTRLRSTKTNSQFLVWSSQRSREFRISKNLGRYEHLPPDQYDEWLMQFVERHQLKGTQ